MIKSLLGEDESDKKRSKKTPETEGDKDNSTQNKTQENTTNQSDVKKENAVTDKTSDENESFEEIKNAIVTGNISSTESKNSVKPFEVNKPIGQPIIEKVSDNIVEKEIATETIGVSPRTLELEKKLREIEEELEKEKETQRLDKEITEKTKLIEAETKKELETKIDSQAEPNSSTNWKDWDKEDQLNKAKDQSIQITQKNFVPESSAESIRKSGMAYSAAIALFGSVVFMLILGWGADLLLGTKPWGIVVGIVIGSIIGLVQFIRTTSQILKPKPNDFDKVSLKSNIESVKNNKIEENLEEKITEITEQKEIEQAKQETVTENLKKSDDLETIVKTDV